MREDEALSPVSAGESPKSQNNEEDFERGRHWRQAHEVVEPHRGVEEHVA